MQIFKDYQNWLTNQGSFLTMLEDNDSPLFERFSDIIKVLNYLKVVYAPPKKIDEDNQVIFETGYAYLFSKVEEIKLYYHNYLNNDPILFTKYTPLINYILHIYDLRDNAIEEEIFTEDIEELFSEIITALDKTISNKEDFSLNDLDKYNDELSVKLPSMTSLTIPQIFSIICEELAL